VGPPVGGPILTQGVGVYTNPKITANKVKLLVLHVIVYDLLDYSY